MKITQKPLSCFAFYLDDAGLQRLPVHARQQEERVVQRHHGLQQPRRQPRGLLDRLFGVGSMSACVQIGWRADVENLLQSACDVQMNVRTLSVPCASVTTACSMRKAAHTSSWSCGGTASSPSSSSE